MCATAVLGDKYLLNVVSPLSSSLLFGFVLTRMQRSSLFCFLLLGKGKAVAGCAWFPPAAT
ncbi:hypothetical protein BJX96DRAFT_157065 [Aspergillus floccosus]